MTGKWHLGQQHGTPPWERGFDRSLNSQAGGIYYPGQTGRENDQFYLNGRRPAARLARNLAAPPGTAQISGPSSDSASSTKHGKKTSRSFSIWRTTRRTSR